ncbi:SAGA-associated factor 29 isoform X2 [Parasteatoda tepidariorum]|nr:SAGA-associated factor 29 isoform X2 [Parasteatoda tepidariorum]
MAANKFPFIQAKMLELHNILLQLEEERLREQSNLDNLTKAFDEPSESKPAIQKMKLVGMYKTCLNNTEIEMDLMQKALGLLNEIQTVRFSSVASKAAEKCKDTINKSNLMDMIVIYGQSLPLWVGESEEPAPPLCGAMQPDPEYIAKVGDLVAACVKMEEDSSKSTWILAEVTGFDSDKNEYTIYDIDEREKPESVIESGKIIPLPLWRAHPTENPEAIFPKNSYVLALYPQTTCFYPAVVSQSPEKPEDSYSLMFEDSSYTGGYSPPNEICQRYVLSFKEIADE